MQLSKQPSGASTKRASSDNQSHLTGWIANQSQPGRAFVWNMEPRAQSAVAVVDNRESNPLDHEFVSDGVIRELLPYEAGPWKDGLPLIN